jgi:hypothetical protein
MLYVSHLLLNLRTEDVAHRPPPQELTTDDPHGPAVLGVGPQTLQPLNSVFLQLLLLFHKLNETS